jgi:hypothetical protein
MTNINRDKWKISFPVLGNNWLACVLKKYGAPPKFCPAVEQMYKDLKMVLKIGEERREILQSVRVRQGDNMALVLFSF